MKRFMKLFFYATGALTLPGLTGCGGSSSATPAGPAVPLPHSASVALPSGLTATVAQDKSSVAAGGVVTYTLTLTNNTAQPITFQPERGFGPSVGVGDAVTVKNAGGGVTYPLGEYGQGLTPGPSSTLAPGRSMSATEAVGLYNAGGTFSPAGRYFTSVTFTLVTAGTSASATAGPLEVDAQ